MRRSWLLLCAAPLAGCFFTDCSSPTFEQSCSDDDPPGEAVVIELRSDGELLEDGTELALDYGSQGGQHFYVSLRAFGAGPDDFVVATFEASDGNAGTAQFFFEQACDSWSQIDNGTLQVDSASASSGTFKVELGQCDGACEFDEAGEGLPLNFVARASDEAQIDLLP